LGHFQATGNLTRVPGPSAQSIDLQDGHTEVDILRRRMDASVSLIKALGGG